MEASSLTGQILKCVWLYRSGPVHPAWQNDLTTAICGTEAILELANGSYIAVRPCEVQLSGDRYPALGLDLSACSSDELQASQPDGTLIAAKPMPEVAPLLPCVIAGVEASDPLGEGPVSQYALQLGAHRLVLRHILPPITLGISVE